jgi:hypothetical protein
VKSRLLAVVAAASVVLGSVLLPAAQADAAGTTRGTIRVQLTTPSGADFHSKGFVVSATGQNVKAADTEKTNSRGVATFKVKPGKYTFVVETYLSKYQYAVSTQKNIKIVRGQTKTIGMKMLKGGVVSGKVKKPNGKALAKAVVAAVNKKGVIVGSTTTDKHGKYILRGLPTGSYAIEFNQRSWHDPKNKATKNYGWDYYGGPSFASAKKIKVYAENRYADETWTKGVSGVVHSGITLHVELTQPGSRSTRLLVDRISSTGDYMQDGSVYGQFTNGRSLTLKVEPGRYRLGVAYSNKKVNTFYYSYYGGPISKQLTKAGYTVIRSTPTDVYVKFGTHS